jgi:NADH-quinone oxidoreductase subunit A
LHYLRLLGRRRVVINDGSAVVIVGEAQNLEPFLIYSLSVIALLAVVLIGSWLLGSRTQAEKATNMPYESGVVPVGSAEQTRLSVEFYLIALFFVVFDLETIFVFAWAVSFYEVGWTGYLGVAVFILILLVALVYELSTGALDWGKRHQVRSGRIRS